ncbi:NACHT domain-containing protein [Limnospira fusiformis KN01]|uniref:NACHT domain-containing protein n=1 Tax=Limnospira fusiformis TaxID=54297 RepID=UPI001658A909|nr:NACHT domain-containing protein [Limnospira fusiformis]ULB45936.1 NACHT domain-containing protein [Limnospira fusiformis KN01]
MTVAMAVARDILKLTIGGGCVLGSLAFPSLVATEGMVWGNILATALGNVAAGNTANAIDALIDAREGGVSLENQDLTKAVGKAIAAVITLAAKQQGGKTRQYLEKIAAQAKDNWVAIAQQELTKQRYPDLREAQLDQFLTPQEYQLTQQGNLTATEWGDIFIRLNMAACKGGGFPIPAEVRQQVAELLHTTFPKALRETLKEDFAKDGKAFAGLTLQLLTGMQAQLRQLQANQEGVNMGELSQVLQQFQELETRLRGNLTQQQEFFRDVSHSIDSGFAEVCERLGVMETTISDLLQTLEERLEELRQEVTEFRQEVRQGLESLHNQPRGRSFSKQEYRNRQNILTQMRTEVESRLTQSIHRAAIVNLGKEQQPQQVQRPWDMSVKVGEQRRVQLPPQTTILDVFDNPTISGKFLILGKPGGGKTTTLLELAEALLERAEGDSDAPIPVILELSTWQEVTKPKFLPFGEREKYDPSIKEWVLSQLISKGVSQDIGEQWLREKELVLLLDGLDELQPERQAKCVRAINQFLSSEFSPLHLVVCSRKEEYEVYEEKLLLNGAICLEDLTNEQIRDYFASVNLGEFWESIKGSEKIIDFIRQPLFLAVTSIAYEQIDVEEWRDCNTEERAIDYLLGVYRVTMINKTQLSHFYKPQKHPKSTVFQNRLVRISCYLNCQYFDTKQISVHSLQPSFLKPKHHNIYTILNFAILMGTGLMVLGISMQPSFNSSNHIIISDYLTVIFAFLGFLYAFYVTTGFLGNSFNSVSELSEHLSKSSNTNKLLHRCLPVFLILILAALFLTFSLYVSFLYFSQRVDTIYDSWLYPNNPFIRLFVLSFGISIVLTGLKGSSIEINQKLNLNKDNFIPILAISSFGTCIFLISFWHSLAIWISNQLMNSPEIPHDSQYGIHLLGFMLSIFYCLTIVFFCKISYSQTTKSKSKLILDMIFTSGFLFIIGGIAGFIPSLSFGMDIALNNGLTLAFIFSLLSGFSCIQYFSLRLILWLTGQMPWNITRFLDYCTERLILQRVGNRYRFIHRLVQEHFANLEIQKE